MPAVAKDIFVSETASCLVRYTFMLSPVRLSVRPAITVKNGLS